MNRIAELIETRKNANPEHVFLFDEATPKGISFEQFYDLTGRIYAYLKTNGVGREDFVLINLPRGVQPVIAMVGVWRAGAAFALVEDTYAPERIKFIRDDCGCKIEINAENWATIMQMAQQDGYADVDVHDAAYAVYTSGTTGNPKGVLHEYGNLNEGIDSLSYKGKSLVSDDERFALAAPLNFVASVMVILKIMDIPTPKFFILSYATVKNPLKLGFFMLEKRISITFLTPSYVRALGSKTGPFLKKLIVGAEPANGIEPHGLDIYNIYAMSESGFAVGIFKIDKSYDTCPIGQPQFDKQIHLLDENGKEVADDEIGELCVDNPYVRGYMNLPEENERAFKNGVYHTGDLAKKLPNGDFVLLGRNTDMVKINGNRVEPAEVEAAVKQVLNLDWCAVRGFEDDEQAFLAAYYTADIPKPDAQKTREALSMRLPYYMLPQYFIHIDKAPLKATGKLDRKALPKPDTSQYVSNYVAPTNETENALCKAMAIALKMKRIGIHDDFYELGGDSLASMQVIVGCGLKGLNASDIFRGRTPEKIAAIYLENHARNDLENFDEKNEKAKKTAHKVTTEQNFMIDYQFYTPISTMYNLFGLIRLEKEMFEPERLAMAVSRVLRHHAVFGTTLEFNRDGDIVQSYHPELIEDIKVEKLSEFDLKHLRDDLVKPFKIMGAKLYRCRLFETEKALYLFLDIHHTIFDGTSFKVMMQNIANAYMETDMEPDYYYLTLQKREDAENSQRYDEARKYYEERYNGDKWTCKLKTDHETRENKLAELESPIGLDPRELKLIEKKFNISRNEFFLTAFALAFAIREKTGNVKFSWIYNGREDVESMSTCGLLFRALPIAFELNREMDIRDVYARTSEQVAKAIENCCYPYLYKNSNVVTDDIPCVLYQSDIREAKANGMVLEQVPIRQNNAASQSIMDMDILDGEDGLKIVIHYSGSRYDRETMEDFTKFFIKICKVLAEHNDHSALTLATIYDRVNPSFFSRLFGLNKR